MKFYRILLFVALTTTLACSGPTRKETRDMLCKTWIAYEYELSDGTKKAPPTDTQNDYLKFESDGSFESLEYGILTIQGTWSLDSSGLILTMKQDESSHFSNEIITRIIKVNENELVLEGTDLNGKKSVIYSKAKE